MRRIALLSVVVAIALPAAAIAGTRAASHLYTVKQVRNAFASSGISLRRQHVPASARYARFASSFPLRVVVFHNEAAAGRKIEVILGSRPSKTCRRGCIVIRFAAPRGSLKPAIQETQVGNVAVVYVKSKHLGPRVQSALRDLRHVHRS